MQQENGADKESPEEDLHAGRLKSRPEPVEQCTGAEEQHAKDRRNDQVEPVQEHQLRKLRQVPNELVIGRKVLAARHPANVGPEESLGSG